MEEFKHTVLCVDDEPNILSALKRLLRKEDYRLLTAGSGKEGLTTLSQNKVEVVVSDHRMPEMNGTEFLKEVKQHYPNIIRIILTGYTDVDTITEAINEGSIYKFFLKPWNDHNLQLELRQALEQYDLIEANKNLNEMIRKQNEELKAVNDNLEAIVKERTHSLEVQNQALQLSHAILEDLPLPIVGISCEMMIVLANKAARELTAADQPIMIGTTVAEIFDPGTETEVMQFFNSHDRRTIVGQSRSGNIYGLDLIPLSDRYNGKGMIMTMRTGQ
jgi:response regulator RpfG family c-di-GMP phosphodiesterase